MILWACHFVKLLVSDAMCLIGCDYWYFFSWRMQHFTFMTTCYGKEEIT